MTHRGNRLWTVLIVFGMVAGLLLSGCENVLNEDGDENNSEDDTGGVEDPAVVEDGSLTASVAGVPTDLESTTEGDEDLLFAAFVFEAGTDVMSESWEENWVALVAEEIVDGSATGTAFQIVDGVPGDEWVGTADESYDVYYTVYRVTLQDDGPPLKGGAHFMESNPECVCGTVDWQSPVTYLQDGDHTLASTFGGFLETSHVEFVAQGALGLISLVMDSLPESGPPAEPGPVTLEPELEGITVAMTQNNSTESTFDAELAITIDDYSFTDTGLDPAPTATGAITLSILAPIVEGEPNVAELEMGFATTDLTLSHGEDGSVEVELDGTATDMGEEGFETFTGTFTCDGAEHDLAIMTDMYDIP